MGDVYKRLLVALFGLHAIVFGELRNQFLEMTLLPVQVLFPQRDRLLVLALAHVILKLLKALLVHRGRTIEVSHQALLPIAPRHLAILVNLLG